MTQQQLSKALGTFLPVFRLQFRSIEIERVSALCSIYFILTVRLRTQIEKCHHGNNSRSNSHEDAAFRSLTIIMSNA
tara:strand:+ start:909 stop:1139 length:231 start_codon:yes stop_codon:yes gene_type:complete